MSFCFVLVGRTPGWYELHGRTSKCQICPPGSYCPGGRAADSHDSMLYQCAEGSTSPSGSVSVEACVCRRGYFWSLQSSACSKCPAGQFKNLTGAGLCQSCPQQTISAQGSIDFHECHCPAGQINIDSTGNFNCADLYLLGNATSNQSFARTESSMYGFNGSISSMSSYGVTLELVKLDLLEYLGLSERASLELTSWTDSGQMDYEISTSEEEEATTLNAKMDPSVFAAWTFVTSTRTLTSETAVDRSPVANEALRCPPGLGFGSDRLIRNQSDCVCTYGMEPLLGQSGLIGGCSKCPRGKFKSSVADVACSSCGGLTTLLEGAISIEACTCPAGFVNEVDDPADCQPCGKGFFCSGGKHKQACEESFTTATETAGAVADCICASGFFRVGTLCQACPLGRFKADIGDGACQPCPPGTWSNESGAAHQDACESCMQGSTTRENASADMSLCVRPEPSQLVQCRSGTICDVEIKGFHLQDGHHLALSKSSCDTNKVALPGVVAQGISKPATKSGSRYVWGDRATDFVPEGGLYNLCWCANMRDLSCLGLRTNFILSAGQLQVSGPLANHLFECVRGQKCFDLSPFQGHSLSVLNQVAVRNSACGGPQFLSLAPANPNGTGSLNIVGNNFALALGEILLDADEGYTICWCGVSCNTASDFAVSAGQLRVLGPYSNQRVDCFLGQECRLQHIRGVGLMAGDQIMLRTDCAGQMLPGSPGDGIASRNDAWQAQAG